MKIGLLPQSDYILQDISFRFQDLYPDISLDIRIINNSFLAFIHKVLPKK